MAVVGQEIDEVSGKRLKPGWTGRSSKAVERAAPAH
jgi:hypothetical protein